MRSRRPARWMFCAGMLVLGCGFSYAADAPTSSKSSLTSTTTPTTSPARGTLSVDAVVEQLTAESATMLDVNSPFVFKTPHPIVAQLASNQSAKLLLRLSKPFTGDPLRDIYIRYQLLAAVVADGDSASQYTPKMFVEVSQALPPEVEFQLRPVRTYDPPEIGAEYIRLLRLCQVTTGFPPFQKTISAPESLQYMDPAKRAEAEGYYKQMVELRPKFKIVDDKGADAWNDRMAWLKWMLHQERGEAAYGIVMCGNADALDTVVAQIAQFAKTDQPRTVELLSFFNAAYFDGWLGQYPAGKLKSTASKLKGVVIEADRAAATPAVKVPAPRPGANGKPPVAQPPKPADVKRKSLSELAFTIITAMENGAVTKRTAGESLVRLPPDHPLLALNRPKVTPQTVQMDTIQDAITRGVTALEHLHPPDTDLGPRSYVASGIISGRAEYILPQYFLPGQQFLAAWAMLGSGESRSALWLQKRVSWTACIATNSTYDRALRLATLGQVASTRWDPWVRRDADWLANSMTDMGGFNPNYVSGPSTGYGDSANGQYAALGFWAAEQSGFDIDPTVWRKVNTYWKDAQFPAGADGAGWATASYKSLKAGANTKSFANQVSGPMTAGGVLALSLSERYLNGPKLTGVGTKPTPEMLNGLKWLDSHFSLGDLGNDADLYYYLWTIQNVGQASGYRTFNKVDWFREATARLLNEQGRDGLWHGPKGDLVSTSFALLYLSRARGPLAVCKVRFDDSETSDWNNRPNDMVNFVDYVSQQLETPTSWQIADLDQPVYQLAESTMLYLATDKPFTLKPEQVARLREYVQAGGLLVAAPEGGSLAPVMASLRALAKQLQPEAELQKVAPNHPFYNLFKKSGTGVPLWAIDNGIRPTMVIVEKDISRDLQVNASKSRDSFDLLANLYLYAAGSDPRRPRIATNYVAASPTDKIGRSIGVARIKYDGNFDPEPAALPQLQALLAKQHLGLTLTTALPAELKDAKVAFLSCTGQGKLADDQMKALHKWIDAGGTLWIDATGGSDAAESQVDDAITTMGFSANDPTPADELPAFTGKGIAAAMAVESPKRRAGGEGARPALRVITVAGRPAVYVMRGDAAAGLAGVNTWRITGYNVATTRQLVVNSLLSIR